MNPARGRIGALALALLAAASLAACGHKAEARGPAVEGPIHVVAAPLPLDPKDPRHERLGDFQFAGALQLTSPDTGLFGGFSDLKVADDGSFVSESDEGSVMRGRIVLGPDGRLAGVSETRIVRLKGLDGRPLDGKHEADSEGVGLWPNGDLMVSFERDHRIWIYPAAGGPPHAAPRPQTPMPDNEGMEGLALAPREGPDAYWVGIEGGDIWLCHLAATCAKAPGQLPPRPGYRLPALFEMPTGDLVVEHHHWDPVTGTHLTVNVIDNPATNPRPRVKAQLALATPLTVDNIEGVAVVPRPGGAWRFYLISDDNFSPDQRTLLMAFDWTPGAGTAGGGKAGKR
ncbi:esterase-like activity of phytase family protein [Caulobacter sp. KR2-114]|uniref:esterase-like activity of phytase family protein n=1 Tax=Caulobacter sp. KR2-114 TaxID=3400912 RepID=UPI003C0E2AA4